MENNVDSSIAKILKNKKIFIQLIVWSIVAQAIFGVIIIVTQNWTVLLGKIQAILVILTISAIFCLLNFEQMESKDKLVRSLGFFSFSFTLITMVLWILATLEIFPMYSYSNSYYMGLSILAKILYISAVLTVSTFLISKFLIIKEIATSIRPLKYTAITCALYGAVFLIVELLGDFTITRATPIFIELFGFAMGIMVLSGIVVGVISSSASKKQKQVKQPKTDEEIRMEVEEKVRREMIEKEVRGQYEKQMKEQAEFENQINGGAEQNGADPSQPSQNGQ